MAVKKIALALAAAILFPRVGAAQSLTREAEMSGGHSSEDFRAGGVQARARAERLDYEAGEQSGYMKRFTAGARVRISRDLSLQVNVLHQPGGFTDGRRFAADVSLTNTIRF